MPLKFSAGRLPLVVDLSASCNFITRRSTARLSSHADQSNDFSSSFCVPFRMGAITTGFLLGHNVLHYNSVANCIGFGVGLLLTNCGRLNTHGLDVG